MSPLTGGLAFAAVAAIGVYVDAKRIGARKGLIRGLCDMGPFEWALGVFLLLIIFLPLYFIKRGTIERAAATAGSDTEDPVIETKEKVSWVRVFLGVTVIFLGLWAIGTMLAPSHGTASYVPPPQPEPPSAKLVLQPGWKITYEDGITYVKGAVQNTSDHTFNLAVISFDLYDKSGARTGTANSNISNLTPGQTWKFKALVLDDEASTVKFGSLQGY